MISWPSPILSVPIGGRYHLSTSIFQHQRPPLPVPHYPLQREVAVEHDAVHTVVAPVQQIRKVVGDLVMSFHASILRH
jgi:hypothetical protein